MKTAKTFACRAKKKFFGMLTTSCRVDEHLTHEPLAVTYTIGESYGTTRGLACLSAKQSVMYLNGVFSVTTDIGIDRDAGK